MDASFRRAELRETEAATPAPVSLSALRAELRAQTHTNAHAAHVLWVESVTIKAVEAYWNAIAAQGLPLREAPTRNPVALGSVAAMAQQFGQAVAKLPVAEAAYQLGQLYTGLLPSDWRAEHGIYYTPPAVAARLLDQAEAAGVNWAKARVLDPAAGAAAFLVPVAVRMLRALGKCSPAIAVQNLNARLRGYERDGFAAWLGHVFIEAAAMPWLRTSGRRLGEIISVRDSLRDIEAATFDLVVGNPPFGRVTLDPEQRAKFARSLFGHANLYGLFLDLALQRTASGGLVSFLTPSSFLAGEYFKNLRGLLWKEAPPVTLDFITPRKGVFEDVLQETVLATYRKDGKRAPATVSFVEPQPSGAEVKVTPGGQCSLPRKATAPWLLPRHADETSLAKRLRAMTGRLADWGYKVSTGPLVWNRFKDQLGDEAGKGAIPLVWAECISSDGQFSFRSERRNHKPYFRPKAGDDWLIVRSACVLLQRTTAKEQARRLIAAEMPASFVESAGGVTVENHLNMLIPLSNKPAVSPALLAAVLNSVAADRAFRCISGSVAVSAYELESLPLPDAAELKAALRGRTDAASVQKAASALYGEDGAD